MEAAEKLRTALLQQAISLEVLASTGLASSVADSEKAVPNAASSPAPAARKGDPVDAGAAAFIALRTADTCQRS